MGWTHMLWQGTYGVNTCALAGYAVPSYLVASILLLLYDTDIVYMKIVLDTSIYNWNLQFLNNLIIKIKVLHPQA